MKNKLFILIIGLFITTIFITGCTQNIETRMIKNNIESLDRSTSVSGSFVLGSGSVNGEPSYEYYIKTSDGGYKLKTVVAKECIVYQNENATPYILAYYTRDNSFVRDNVYSERGDIGDYYVTLPVSDWRKYDYFTLVGDVEIHIPPNSIVKEFKP